jgi:hypothetical protein
MSSGDPGDANGQAEPSGQVARVRPGVDAVSLNGDRVRNCAGRVEGVLVDESKGCIAYAVLSLDASFDSGGKLLAVPWSVLAVDTVNERIILDVSKSRLKAASRFRRGQWPTLADSRWQYRANRYYGLRS